MKINRNILPKCNPGVIDFYIGRGDDADALDNYSGDSICWYVGDFTNHFADNRELLASMLQVPQGSIMQPHQTHSSRVVCIDNSFFDAPFTDRAALLEGTDALVTSLPDIVIGVNTADCVPILFYDPTSHMAAAAHAGWRGTASRIAEATVQAMVAHGASILTMQVGIGVAISEPHYEVGDEVVEALKAANIPLATLAHRHVEPHNKYHVDLREANLQILLQCGIDPANIKVSTQCTYATPSLYSARRQGINSGRNYTAILLR